MQSNLFNLRSVLAIEQAFLRFVSHLEGFMNQSEGSGTKWNFLKNHSESFENLLNITGKAIIFYNKIVLSSFMDCDN